MAENTNQDQVGKTITKEKLVSKVLFNLFIERKAKLEFLKEVFEKLSTASAIGAAAQAFFVLSHGKDAWSCITSLFKVVPDPVSETLFNCDLIASFTPSVSPHNFMCSSLASSHVSHDTMGWIMFSVGFLVRAFFVLGSQARICRIELTKLDQQMKRLENNKV